MKAAFISGGMIHSFLLPFSHRIVTPPSAHAGSSARLAINPFLSRLKRNGQGFRLRWNALMEWHDDTGMTIRVVSRLSDLNHR